MLEKEYLDEWDCDQNDRNASWINDQLCNCLCLHVKDEALTMVKHTKMKPGVNGVACCWWKFNHDCPALAVQRIQALANAICEVHRVRKYVEKWERSISRFEAAIGKIADETVTFSLVPDEVGLLEYQQQQYIEDL